MYYLVLRSSSVQCVLDIWTIFSYLLLPVREAPYDYSCRHLTHVAQTLALFSDLFVFFCLLAMLDEDEEDRVDETALQQLTEMGFPESRAIKALRLNQ